MHRSRSRGAELWEKRCRCSAKLVVFQRKYFDDKYVDFQGGEGGARRCLWVLGQVKVKVRVRVWFKVQPSVMCTLPIYGGDYLCKQGLLKVSLRVWCVFACRVRAMSRRHLLNERPAGYLFSCGSSFLCIPYSHWGAGETYAPALVLAVGRMLKFCLGLGLGLQLATAVRSLNSWRDEQTHTQRERGR
ncbi:uncharacterized protein LY79DRAFT_207200 [Colletotrichum navitas]|uniref:Uncharacterized protein n=1 Tax=Colletotrichum navitas TaxID=681940 RepID=A0AAD8QCZ4_9PEZI|nr:uncharacterized protein LY79DRAFT_207200 [Colletotrichum navitas]KAK1599068.1 hypothetical protein LY79DRAFT_207200 [Colletotrichum navitas]